MVTLKFKDIWFLYFALTSEQLALNFKIESHAIRILICDDVLFNDELFKYVIYKDVLFEDV